MATMSLCTTARSRDILRNYSSAQVLNELLQNADDAGSTQFKVLISERTFGTASLLSPALAHTQGAALYQFDDAQFDPDDYESIQRVGDGTKMGDPTKTGQVRRRGPIPTAFAAVLLLTRGDLRRAIAVRPRLQQRLPRHRVWLRRGPKSRAHRSRAWRAALACC
jgi:hypothetical protein